MYMYMYIHLSISCTCICKFITIPIFQVRCQRNSDWKLPSLTTMCLMARNRNECMASRRGMCDEILNQSGEKRRIGIELELESSGTELE